jgi:DNA-binding transcriptional ArsR family regulator
MPSKDIDVEKIESELRGTTLRIYWQVFKSNRPVGVREIQRAVNLSSPSTALYHLEKLRELGLLRKDEYGRYHLIEEIKVGLMRSFMRIGRLVMPRFLFYGTFFLAGVILYTFLSLARSTAPNLMALIFGLSAAAISWYEVTRIWKERLI